MNPKERYREAIDFFYTTNYRLAGQASKLGYPSMVDGFPYTAGVLWNKDKRKIDFAFNNAFCEKLDDDHFNFTVAHETTHVINGHVFMLKSEIDRLKAQGASKQEISKWMRKFNKAADCVVNDTLVNLYGIPRCEFRFLTDKDKCPIFYGKETVGCDCHDLSVIDVMYLLPENESEEEQQDFDDHSMWQSFFNDDGSLNRDFVDAMQDFLEGNMDNPALSDAEIEELENLQNSMQDCSDPYARQAGRSSASSTRKIEAQTAAVRWEKILFKKVERNKFEDKWNRRSRKLSGFPPDLLLPVNQAKEVEDIFVAIDVSGSIDFRALDLFISVVKNTPKHFKINAITFNTMCKPFDIKSSKVRSGGGTSFHIIEEYIQQNLPKYPKAVFVLTDGCGSPVEPQYPSRWTWMLYGSCSTAYCKGMSHYNLESLLK